MEKKWTTEYWEKMAALNIEEAIPLKNDNFPDSFYKYKALTTQTIEAIEQN